MTNSIQLHPLCSLFPRMEDSEFSALVADIRANGQREPIVIHNGMILDGGNRWRACVEAGIKPHTRKFDGGNLVEYVFSVNLHRRHLASGQKAAIVASCRDWANVNQHGGNRASAHREHLNDTTKTRAAESKTSISTQRRADAVAKADPELINKVARGEIPLGNAVEEVAPKLAARPAKQRISHDFRTESQKALDDPAIKLEMTEDAMEALQDENESLRNQIAAMIFEGSSEERNEYLARLDTLTTDNKRLLMLNKALTNARDAAMADSKAFSDQNKYLQRQAKKAC